MTGSVDDILNNVHVGVNDADNSSVLNDDETQGTPDANADFEIETDPVFDQLADKMYEGDKAALREGLTNAVTAVKRAINGDHIEDGEGVIELRYYEGGSGGNGVLVLRDNGIGMSWEEIQKVVTRIGVTTARDDGDLAGQFGMGFLALFKLVGLRGSFIMHTNSRLSDDKFSSIWSKSGCERDLDGKFTHPFDDDEYGVQFEFPLKDGIGPNDVTEWLGDIEWSRVPIVYEHYGPDGDQIDNDEIGGRSLQSVIPDENPFAEYEDEFVHAITGPGVRDRTILLDVPIRRNAEWGVWDEAPWGQQVLVRLKNEKGVVVDGPNRGLMTANPAEYESMDADRKAKFISTDDLHPDDIAMPGPRGNRDVLDPNREFWEWLSLNLKEDYISKLTDVVNRVESFDDILALEPREFQMVQTQIPSVPEEENLDEDEESDRELPRYDPDEYAEDVRENLGDEFDYACIERLNLALLDIEHVSRDCNDATSASNHRERALLHVLYDAQGEGRDGDIFMGATMNHDRCCVVWDDNPNNEVIAVDGTEWYPVLDRVFAIRKLKKITKSRLDEYDISDEVRDQFLTDTSTSNTKQPVEHTKLTVHFGRDGTKQHTSTRNISVGEFEMKCDDAHEQGYEELRWATNPERVIAFPRRGDHPLGDYKLWLSSNRVAAISVTTTQWEYLKGTPFVTRIDDYIAEAEQEEFLTSEGVKTVHEAKATGNFVIHHVPADTLELFQDDEIMERIATILQNEEWTEDNYAWNVASHLDADQPVVYAPMATEMVDNIRPLMNDDATFVMANEESHSYGDPGQRLRTPPDTMLYATARLGEWQDTPELQVIEGGLNALSASLTRKSRSGEYDVLSLVDTLAMLHDSGVPPASQQEK